MIEAFITNLGKYNEGMLVGEYLKLPATIEDVQALLSRIDVDGVMYEEIFITDYEISIDGLRGKFGEYESIDELNYLSSLIEEMDTWDLEMFKAAVEYGEYTHSVGDLINLTQNLNCFELYHDVNDHDDLGRYVMENFEAKEIPDWMDGYFDYSSYGYDFDRAESGGFVKEGYIRDNGDSFIKHYKGRADLLDEHKIFAYPEPTKSIQQTLANYKQMIDEASTSLSHERASTVKLER